MQRAKCRLVTYAEPAGGAAVPEPAGDDTLLVSGRVEVTEVCGPGVADTGGCALVVARGAGTWLVLETGIETGLVEASAEEVGGRMTAPEQSELTLTVAVTVTVTVTGAS